MLLNMPLSAEEPSDQKLKVLYNRLDPYSVTQHLAFYDLYGHRAIGQKALGDAWTLLTGSTQYNQASPLSLPGTAAINSLIALVTKDTSQPAPSLTPQELILIESLSRRLAHVRLKGHDATDEEQVIALPPEQIDLARGLFLSQFGPDLTKLKVYEAMLDLMALQVLARLPSDATHETKIQALNAFIFEEMRFRFPPHSVYKKEIEAYTSLPDILDSHRGVCLGVSILYLCLAQRLDLPLEMITPPGHIYVRYRNGDKIINIETTARGIHVDCEEYLSVNTRALQLRTIKEVIGLAHVNYAAYFLQRGDFKGARTLYQKAVPYLPDDPLVSQLLGYACLLVGETNRGRALLEKIRDHLPDHSITKDTTPEDYLNGYADLECLKAMFQYPEEDRQSLLAHKTRMEQVVKQHPRFRSGLLQLALAWLQLHRTKEALEVLNQYLLLDNNDPEVHLYLTNISIERKDYPKAWVHLRETERLVHARDYNPKPIKELRKQLASTYPE